MKRFWDFFRYCRKLLIKLVRVPSSVKAVLPPMIAPVLCHVARAWVQNAIASDWSCPLRRRVKDGDKECAVSLETFSRTKLQSCSPESSGNWFASPRALLSFSAHQMNLLKRCCFFHRLSRRPNMVSARNKERGVCVAERVSFKESQLATVCFLHYISVDCFFSLSGFEIAAIEG